MKKTCTTIILAFLLPLAAAAQAKPAVTPAPAPGAAQRYIEMIASAEPLQSAQIGVLAIRMSGDTVASYRPIAKRTPASNAKLITTGAAMRVLGSDYRFRTGIGTTGSLGQDGTLHGDVYIIGGGDPTLGSKDSIATNTDALFGQWRSMLLKAGIKKIDGRVIGDGRWAEGPSERGSWLYEDIGTYYGAGSNGLSFYRNIKDFQISAGAKPGDPLTIVQGYPDTPWMKYTYNCATGEKGTGDKLFLYTTDVAPFAVLRGTFGVDRKTKKVECSNKYGAYTCASYFTAYLKAKGMAVTGGAADIDETGKIRTRPGTASGEAAAVSDSVKLLGSTLSPSLKRIAYITNQRSDNFYAEALWRAIGKKLRGSASYDSCAVAINDAFKSMGLNPYSGVFLEDGSGLSRKDGISPAFMCSFLKNMLDSTSAEDFVGTLTQPNVGSQAGRMRNEPAEIRARVWYKSGSMDGVRCYSGYITPTDGGKEDTIVFSVMVNAYTGPNWKIMGQIDKIIALLAAEN